VTEREILLRSEIPSGMCAKLRTVAASNNRDHPTRSLYYCLFAPHTYIFVLRAHPVRGESHNQRNTTAEVTTILVKQIQRKNEVIQHFSGRMVERSRSQWLVAEHWERSFNDCNAARSPLEMQTTPSYCDIIISTDTKVHKQGYNIYSLTRFVITDAQVW